MGTLMHVYRRTRIPVSDRVEGRTYIALLKSEQTQEERAANYLRHRRERGPALPSPEPGATTPHFLELKMSDADLLRITLMDNYLHLNRLQRRLARAEGRVGVVAGAPPMPLPSGVDGGGNSSDSSEDPEEDPEVLRNALQQVVGALRKAQVSRSPLPCSPDPCCDTPRSTTCQRAA